MCLNRSAAGPWSKLGSFEQSRKENTQRATAWAGQMIKQQPAHSAPPAPALDIPVDPEFQEQAAALGPEAVSSQQVKGGKGVGKGAQPLGVVHMAGCVQ